MNNEKCKVCGGTRCVYTGPIGDPPEECEACFDQEPAAPTAGDAGAIDTPEFWKLANAWGCASQFKPRTELAVALVAHVNQHLAAAVKAEGERYKEKLGQFAEDAFKAEQRARAAEAELAKLRAATAPVKIPGLGRITNEDDGFYTLQFVNEDAGQAFMQQYEPSVDVEDMPDVLPHWETTAPASPSCGKCADKGYTDAGDPETGATKYDYLCDCGAGAPVSAAEQAQGDVLPEGWEASHLSPSPGMTDEFNDSRRYMVKRLEAPFCGKDNQRVWFGSTLSAALQEGHKSLGRTYAAPAAVQELPALEDFDSWWQREQACPEHGMITQNAARAAWTRALAMRQPQGDEWLSDCLGGCWYTQEGGATLKLFFADEKHPEEILSRWGKMFAAKQAGKAGE